MDSPFKEPYEVILAKLELAELTILLAKVTQQKWTKHESMKDILMEEERLIREIALKTDQLDKMKTA